MTVLKLIGVDLRKFHFIVVWLVELFAFRVIEYFVDILRFEKSFLVPLSFTLNNSPKLSG